MISIVMLSNNSSETIKESLDALIAFEEVVVIDTGSKDNTIEIVKSYKNTKVFQENFQGFGVLRNKGAQLAKYDWILAIDSDEVIPNDLSREILKENLNPENIYGFYFHNFFNKKHIKCCGWYPEKHLRLYNKRQTGFSDSLVHEKLIDKHLNIKYFKNPIFHFSYRKIDDFLQKMSKYSSLFAEQNKNKKKSSLSKAIIHGFFAFFKSYIIKRGFLAKKEGFIISLYNANTAFYKYLKLAEINSKDKCF